MVYADYEYYNEKYKGALPENSFDSIILKASREIDKNVNTRLNDNKVSNLPEEAQEQLKYTACALVDFINKKQEDESKKVSSISIDGVNKNYKTLSFEDMKKEKIEILRNLPDELTCFL